jgi:hypothetical protein
VSLGAWQTRRVHVVGLAAALCVIGFGASGCGGSHHKAAAPPPRWVQRANAICKVDDRKIRNSGDFDSAAWFSALRRELRELVRAGLFPRLPSLVLDMERTQRVERTRVYDPQKLDRALLKTKRDAARKGVRCSFGSVPLIHA